MDYLRALTEAAFSSASNGEQLIGYNNGLLIMALLLVIYWGLIKQKRRMTRTEFPRFCDDCVYLVRLKSGLCRKKCRFHPGHQASASKSHYRKKA